MWNSKISIKPNSVGLRKLLHYIKWIDNIQIIRFERHFSIFPFFRINNHFTSNESHDDSRKSPTLSVNSFSLGNTCKQMANKSTLPSLFAQRFRYLIYILWSSFSLVTNEFRLFSPTLNKTHEQFIIICQHENMHVCSIFPVGPMYSLQHGTAFFPSYSHSFHFDLNAVSDLNQVMWMVRLLNSIVLFSMANSAFDYSWNLAWESIELTLHQKTNKQNTIFSRCWRDEISIHIARVEIRQPVFVHNDVCSFHRRHEAYSCMYGINLFVMYVECWMKMVAM